MEQLFQRVRWPVPFRSPRPFSLTLPSSASTSINPSELDTAMELKLSRARASPQLLCTSSCRFSSTTPHSQNTPPIALHYGQRATGDITDLLLLRGSLFRQFAGLFPTLYIMAVLTECSTYFQMMNSYFEAQNAVVAAGKGNGLLPIHLDTFGLGNGLTVSFSTSETMSTTAILV